MTEPAVFAQQVTPNVDQIRCLECPTDVTSLHVQLESLAGDKVTLCLDAVEVERFCDNLRQWLRYVDEVDLGEP